MEIWENLKSRKNFSEIKKRIFFSPEGEEHLKRTSHKRDWSRQQRKPEIEGRARNQNDTNSFENNKKTYRQKREKNEISVSNSKN